MSRKGGTILTCGNGFVKVLLLYIWVLIFESSN